MKIIINDFVDKAICELVLETIDIILFKINHNELKDEDYDMIKEHLKYYKYLLKEAKNNEREN